jgi:hypothetical protein
VSNPERHKSTSSSYPAKSGGREFQDRGLVNLLRQAAKKTSGPIRQIIALMEESCTKVCMECELDTVCYVLYAAWGSYRSRHE